MYERKCPGEACIITGDFNVNGKNHDENSNERSEYRDLIDLLSLGEPIQNVLLEKFGYFPVTFGRVDENGEPYDTVLTIRMA